MQRKTVSISLENDLYLRMKQIIPSKQVSKFVASAINKELSIEELKLEEGYKKAELDLARKQEIKEWDELDDNH